jgi:hypothetical protein
MCSVGTVKPYALMIAPIYVFMRKNDKFVSVKAPMDFFTEQELERLKSFQMLFVPEFVDRVLPYRQIARRLKRVMNLRQGIASRGIGLAPFELSDVVIRLLAPLWGTNQVIESFFVSVFVNEFCNPLPAAELTQAREKDLGSLERALMISSWMVLLGLQVGITDLDYLNHLRLGSFHENIGWASESVASTFSIRDADLRELHQLLKDKFGSASSHPCIGVDFFEGKSERIAQKISSRLKRMRDGVTNETPLEATIYGVEGFVDV